jgi:tetratricopeptide (TPR) repeat protein
LKGWHHAALADIPRRDGWVPIRDHFGIRAFGIDAWVGREPGDTIIGEHAEIYGRHEELYVVLAGHAKFTVAGEEVDAPMGTLVFVRDPDALRSAAAVAAETTVLAIGAKPGEAFRIGVWELASEETKEAFAHYNEQRYREAADVMRRVAANYPEHAGAHYNLACFAALSGAADEAFDHLRIAVEQHRFFAEAARADSDFNPIRHDPQFESIVAGKTGSDGAGA